MRRTTLYGILVALVLGTLISVVPASASAAGRRNTALALTGLAAYELMRGHTGTGIIAGAGAVYAWQRAQQAREAERWQRRYGYGYDPYYNDYGSYNGYGSYGSYGSYGDGCGSYGSGCGSRHNDYGRDYGGYGSYYGYDRYGYGYGR